MPPERHRSPPSDVCVRVRAREPHHRQTPERNERALLPKMLHAHRRRRDGRTRVGAEPADWPSSKPLALFRKPGLLGPLSVSPVTCIVWEYSWRSVLCARARAALCGEYSCKRRFRCKYRPPACTLYPWLIGYTPGSGPGVIWLMPVSDERVDAYRHAYRLPVRVPGSPRVRGRGTLQRFVSTKHDNGNRHAGLRPPRMRHVGVMV